MIGARPIGAGAHPNQEVLLRVLCALCEIKAFLTELAETAKETAQPIGAGARPNRGILLRVLCALCEIKAVLTERAESAKKPLGPSTVPRAQPEIKATLPFTNKRLDHVHLHLADPIKTRGIMKIHHG